ncbi:hypothetical protein T11_10385 [Trichinella zimbabwensis]|uniref:Uncharacterized protein n=1 Tax=Trichinella zimbabwensis TaxID=268475 RepID=A0A0V1GNY1_9BILA|nr:hypothetical protein T11_10385 [Trichinella zimbabwensis]
MRRRFEEEEAEEHEEEKERILYRNRTGKNRTRHSDNQYEMGYRNLLMIK